MKGLIFLVLLAPIMAVAQDAGDLCTKWFDFSGQAQSYEAMKQQMSEEQIKEAFPDLARDYRTAKNKYEIAKKQYEKSSKKKFNPNTCR